MTYDELLAKIEKSEADMCSLTVMDDDKCEPIHEIYNALRAVVELHKPMWDGEYCGACHPDHNGSYPCPTIQAIEKELA